MTSPRRVARPVSALAALALLLTTLAVAAVVPAGPAGAVDIAPGSAYRQTNISSDIPGLALIQDPLLVNPWGIGMSPSSTFNIANDGTSTNGLYRTGNSSTIVRHPTYPYLTIPGGLPTGVVANPSPSGFKISAPNTTSQPAKFLWASITGNIVGWHENVPAGNKSGRIAASHPGHVYTGLAGGSYSGAYRLYAADFANGTIDVYNSNFALIASGGNFNDPTIPTTMGNTYHPYNIQALGGSLYVTYAKMGTNGLAEDGVGNGFVRRFNMDGVRDLTFGINNGALNSPWGATVAPATFGIFGGALLIGNEGIGNPSIHAYNPTTGAFLGTLQDDGGTGIAIDGLHALTFGNGTSAGNVNTLYFTAGIGDEEHGLFGSLVPTPDTAASQVGFSSSNYIASEGAGSLQITVTRSGNVASAATVRYSTWDQSQPDHASQKSDYQINTGVLTLPAGQTSASFTILIGEDKFDENNEIVDLSLSNPKGTQLGGFNRATLTINDNDTGAPTSNPLDGNGFFVTRQYLDFFNRQPDPGGLAHWKKKLDDCGFSSSCLKAKRVEVSAAFFLSSEFQNGMSLAYRANKTAFGRPPLYGELMLDNQVRRGGGTSGLFTFVAGHPEYVSATNPLTNTQFVDKLIANSGGTFSSSKRTAWINALNGTTKSRTTVLTEIASDSTVQTSVFRPAFVFMQYAGYLRRDPDTSGFNYWLNRLNSYNGDYVAAGMVRAFVESNEYRQRFGPT